MISGERTHFSLRAERLGAARRWRYVKYLPESLRKKRVQAR